MVLLLSIGKRLEIWFQVSVLKYWTSPAWTPTRLLSRTAFSTSSNTADYLLYLGCRFGTEAVSYSVSVWYLISIMPGICLRTNYDKS